LFFNTAVGIDIRKDQVIVVCLKRSVSGLRLFATDKCLLDPEKKQTDQIPDIALFIDGFLKTHKISTADIFIGVPAGRWIFRQLEFPLAVRENLASTLAYEMEKYIPLDVDDVYFDYQIISSDKTKETFALVLAVVKKSDLKPFLEIVEKLSAPVSGITVGLSGVANSYLHHCGQEAGDFLVVAYPDQTYPGLVVLSGNAMAYAKKIPANTDAGFTADQLIASVKSFQPGDQPVIMAIHATQAQKELENALSEAQGISFSGLVQPDPGLPDATSIAAYGLALQAADSGSVLFNLMPADLRKKPNRLPWYAMYALGVLFFIAVVSWAGINTARQYAWLNDLNQEIAGLRKEAVKVDELRSDIERLEARMGQLNSLRPGNTCVIDVLLELTRIMPDNGWIRDLNISGNNVILYGYADSASDLITMLEESSLFHNAEFLATIRKNRDGQEVYRIGFKFNQN
jgi:general secretion pathway protein L